jgi:hypothetical protein
VNSQIWGSAFAVMDLNSTNDTVKKWWAHMCLPSLLVLSGPLVVVKTSVGFNTDSEDPLVCREEKNTIVSRQNQGIQETSDWKRKTQLSADYRKEFKRQRVENEIQEFMPKANNVLLTLKSEQKKLLEYHQT